MISIQEVDINDARLLVKIAELISLAFNQDKPEIEFLKKNILCEESSLPSIFLVAFDGDHLVGCNAFIANDFCVNQEFVPCFQSCWSATHPEYQGQGIFIAIQQEAKNILAERGGSFIYGLPNDASHPIFVKKLNFFEVDCLFARIPNIPIIRNLWINKSFVINRGNTQTIEVNERQIAKFKKNLNSNIIEMQVGSSYAWGKIQSRKKFNLNIKVFTLGGMYINTSKDFLTILNEIYSLDCHFIEILSCKSNSCNNFFKNWKKSLSHRFIFYNLTNVQNNFQNINLMKGISDTF
jgi:hypothetical protein